MAQFFGASLLVIVFIVGIVCLISAILGSPFQIGPVQVPAPKDLLPRVALATLGAVLTVAALWPSLFPGKNPLQFYLDLFGHQEPDTFAATSDKYAEWLEHSSSMPASTVRVETGNIYFKVSSSAKYRCQVIRALIDAHPHDPDVIPRSILDDAFTFSKNKEAPDVKVLTPCAKQLTEIQILATHVTQGIIATAPETKPATKQVSSNAVARRTPEIRTTNNTYSAETTRRVLAANTLPSDQGWMFIGFRTRDSSALVYDRSIAAPAEPATGSVVIIADSPLYRTSDPATSLGDTIGLVKAGSVVNVRRISRVPYSSGNLAGFQDYAFVSIQSTPQLTVASAMTPSVGVTASPGTTAQPSMVKVAYPNVCGPLPTSSATLFVYCDEAYPKETQFGAYQFHVYKVKDSHNTGLHFRNLGPRRVLLTVYPRCPTSVSCPPVANVAVPPAPAPDDPGNDYIYTAPTLTDFNFGWTMEIST